MPINTTKNVPKMFQEFSCKKCDYTCSKKSVFEKHLLTVKHNTTLCNIIQPDLLSCECGKTYAHRGSLYHHKRKCDKMFQNVPDHKSDDDEMDLKNVILKVMAENKELINMVSDQQKTIQTIVPTIGNNNNNINNKFNINVYLNEDCKDAITMEELTESIKLTMGDLYSASQCGLITNVQNLLITRLSETDETKRPIHCTDLKRKTMYIKNRDGWGKDENNNKVRASIVKLANDHMTCFANQYEDCVSENSIVDNGSTDQFINIMTEVSKEVEVDEQGLNKAIKTIAGAVVL